MKLYLVVKRKFNDFFVLYVVIVLRIVLEYGSIACNNLKFVIARLIRKAALSQRSPLAVWRRLKFVLKLLVLLSLESLRNSDDHRTSVFEYVHVLRFKD